MFPENLNFPENFNFSLESQCFPRISIFPENLNVSRESQFFPRISIFPETEPRETLRFEGNKVNCFTRDQSLSDLLYSPRTRTFSCKNL